MNLFRGTCQFDLWVASGENIWSWVSVRKCWRNLSSHFFKGRPGFFLGQGAKLRSHICNICHCAAFEVQKCWVASRCARSYCPPASWWDQPRMSHFFKIYSTFHAGHNLFPQFILVACLTQHGSKHAFLRVVNFQPLLFRQWQYFIKQDGRRNDGKNSPPHNVMSTFLFCKHPTVLPKFNAPKFSLGAISRKIQGFFAPNICDSYRDEEPQQCCRQFGRADVCSKLSLWNKIVFAALMSSSTHCNSAANAPTMNFKSVCEVAYNIGPM